MLRVTWVLVAEAVVLSTLAFVLFTRPYDSAAVRGVATVLALFAVFVTIMLAGQRKLLAPFVKRVGICELCAKK